MMCAVQSDGIGLYEILLLDKFERRVPFVNIAYTRNDNLYSICVRTLRNDFSNRGRSVSLEFISCFPMFPKRGYQMDETLKE